MAQILAEMELYVRQKNLMMFAYKDELWSRQDDSRVVGCILNIKKNLEIGPSKKGFYEWSEDVGKVKEHFVLEIETLEYLIKCKNSALK